MRIYAPFNADTGTGWLVCLCFGRVLQGRICLAGRKRGMDEEEERGGKEVREGKNFYG